MASDDSPPMKPFESTRRFAVSLGSGPFHPELGSREWGMQQELDASKLVQDSLVAQLSALQAASDLGEAKASKEVSMLQSSLASMASALAVEKDRIRMQEEVTGLRATVEESRKAIGRLQADSGRRNSSMGPPSRRSSLGLISTVPKTIGVPVHQVAPDRASAGSPSDKLEYLSSKMPGAIGPPEIQKGLQGKCASGSRSAGLFDLDYKFGAESEKRKEIRDSGSSGMQSSSISEDFGGYSRPESILPESVFEPNLPAPSTPPSATLRTAGRNNSFAVFDDFPRRDSALESPIITPRMYNYGWSNIAPEQRANEEQQPMDPIPDQQSLELMEQVAQLTMRLDASEERGRRTALSLAALARFISEEGDIVRNSKGLGVVILPVTPGEHIEENYRPDQSRWSAMRLPFAADETAMDLNKISPTDSSDAPPNWTTRVPNSLASLEPKAAKGLTGTIVTDFLPTVGYSPLDPVATFGAFSFSNVVPKAEPFHLQGLQPLPSPTTKECDKTNDVGGFDMPGSTASESSSPATSMTSLDSPTSPISNRDGRSGDDKAIFVQLENGFGSVLDTTIV